MGSSGFGRLGSSSSVENRNSLGQHQSPSLRATCWIHPRLTSCTRVCYWGAVRKVARVRLECHIDTPSSSCPPFVPNMLVWREHTCSPFEFTSTQICTSCLASSSCTSSRSKARKMCAYLSLEILLAASVSSTAMSHDSARLARCRAEAPSASDSTTPSTASTRPTCPEPWPPRSPPPWPAS